MLQIVVIEFDGEAPSVEAWLACAQMLCEVQLLTPSATEVAWEGFEHCRVSVTRYRHEWVLTDHSQCMGLLVDVLLRAALMQGGRSRRVPDALPGKLTLRDVRNAKRVTHRRQWGVALLVLGLILMGLTSLAAGVWWLMALA